MNPTVEDSDIEEQKLDDILIKCSDQDYNASFDELLSQDLAELPESEKSFKINFQNTSFDLQISRTTPVEILMGNDLPQFKNLVSFLTTLEKNNLLQHRNRDKKVVYADD